MNSKIETLGDEERSFESEDEERSNISDLFASQDDEAGGRQQPGLTESLDSTSGGNVPVVLVMVVANSEKQELATVVRVTDKVES